MKPLKYGRLVELLCYDPETGIFTWRFSRSNVPAGIIAGHVSKATGYREIRIDGQSYMAHRLAWYYMTGDWPLSETIDHRNLRRDDNRFNNLRDATFAQNSCNRPAHVDNVVGVKGVSPYWRDPSRFVAQICIDGKQTYLGLFDTVGAADAAYRAAAQRAFGEFAYA